MSEFQRMFIVNEEQTHVASDELLFDWSDFDFRMNAVNSSENHI